MEVEMEELERVQTRILKRIADLELQLSLSSDDDATAERLSGILRSNGVKEFNFKVVPSDYYDRSLEARRDLLSAPSIHHLCKSIVLVRLMPFTFNSFTVSQNFFYTFRLIWP